MIRKLASGEYRLYSRKKDAKTGKRRNLGTFNTRAAAEKHERAVQHFKRQNRAIRWPCRNDVRGSSRRLAEQRSIFFRY